VRQNRQENTITWLYSFTAFAEAASVWASTKSDTHKASSRSFLENNMPGVGISGAHGPHLPLRQILTSVDQQRQSIHHRLRLSPQKIRKNRCPNMG